MSKSTKKLTDRTAFLSELYRRLDALAYFLVADDACVAVAFFAGIYLISNNDGKSHFIEECMPFFQSVGESQDPNHQAEKRRELVNKALIYRMKRFKEKVGLEEKYEEAMLDQENLDPALIHLHQDLNIEDYDSVYKCLASIQSLINDMLNPEEKCIVQEVKKLQELSEARDKATKDANDEHNQFKNSSNKNDSTRQRELLTKWKSLIALHNTTKQELSRKKEELKLLIHSKRSDIKSIEFFYSSLDSVRMALNDIKDTKSTVQSKLNRCMRKVLYSLTSQYKGEEVHKNFVNFNKDMIDMKYLYIPPTIEESPSISVDSEYQTPKQRKVHAEMNLVQVVYEKTSKVSNFGEMTCHIYIGNCMLACAHCDRAFQELNNFLTMQKNPDVPFLFEYRGNHEWAFPGWMEPQVLINLNLKCSGLEENSETSGKSGKSGKSKKSKKREKPSQTVLNILSIEQLSRKPKKILCPEDSESDVEPFD